MFFCYLKEAVNVKPACLRFSEDFVRNGNLQQSERIGDLILF